MRKFLLAFALAACSSDSPPTVYDVAYDYATHVCDYFEACDALGDQTYDDCLVLVIEGTCPDGSCWTDEEWHGSEAQRDACFADVDAASCDDVNGDPPSSCAGLL